MKRIFFLLFFPVSLLTSAQDEIFSLDFYRDLGEYEDTIHAQGGTFKASLYVSPNVSLDYNFGWTNREDGLHQIHTPFGLVYGAPIFAKGVIDLAVCAMQDDDSTQTIESDTSDCRVCDMGAAGVLVGGLIMAIPDGITVHVRPVEWLSISPYANFIGMDFTKEDGTGEKDLVYSASLGTSLTFNIGKARISGKYEWRKHKDIGGASMYGVGIGFRL
jgi:hypothetical protein